MQLHRRTSSGIPRRQARGRGSPPLLSEILLLSSEGIHDLTLTVFRVDMKAILAEAEEMQAASRTQLPVAGVQRQRSGDRMRVSFSLSKTPDSPHLSPLSTSRATPTPAWRVSAHSHSGEPSSYPPGYGRAAKTPPSPARPLARTPPVGTQTGSDKPTPSQLSGGPIVIQKSRSLQSSSPGSSTLAPPSRPGRGPVISPSKSKAGPTASRQASYVPPHPIQAHLID